MVFIYTSYIYSINIQIVHCCFKRSKGELASASHCIVLTTNCFTIEPSEEEVLQVTAQATCAAAHAVCRCSPLLTGLNSSFI